MNVVNFYVMKMLKLFSIMLSVFLLVSCQTEEREPQSNYGELSMLFHITNYFQYGFDDLTRTAAADKLAHLAFAVYDADADTLVSPLIQQDRGSEGYGTFNVRLPYGNYRLLFLGYDGNKQLVLTSPHSVAFAEDYVPHTFLYSTLLQITPDTPPARDIVLKRVVSAFRLSLLDAIPAEVHRFCMQCDVGGSVLDATTGFSGNSDGRTAFIDIPADSHGKKGVFLTYYLYMPTTEATANLTLSAVGSDGNIFRSRCFQKVPMALNRLTVYEGEFFSEDSIELHGNIAVDYDWTDTLSVKF